MRNCESSGQLAISRKLPNILPNNAEDSFLSSFYTGKLALVASSKLRSRDFALTIAAVRQSCCEEKAKARMRFGKAHRITQKSTREPPRNRRIWRKILNRHENFGRAWLKCYRGRTEEPINAASMEWAACRPSRIAQTTRDCPRRTSPAV